MLRPPGGLSLDPGVSLPTWAPQTLPAPPCLNISRPGAGPGAPGTPSTGMEWQGEGQSQAGRASRGSDSKLGGQLPPLSGSQGVCHKVEVPGPQAASSHPPLQQIGFLTGEPHLTPGNNCSLLWWPSRQCEAWEECPPAPLEASATFSLRWPQPGGYQGLLALLPPEHGKGDLPGLCPPSACAPGLFLCVFGFSFVSFFPRSLCLCLPPTP